MRLLLISRYPQVFDTPRGGVESVTLILARALAKFEKIDVHVVTIEQDQSTEKIEKDGAVTIHRLPGSKWPQIIAILAGPGKNSIKRKIKELQPDIVHSHETYGLTLGNIGVPHLFTVHGFDHENIPTEGRDVLKLRSWLWKQVENYGLARQEAIISISPYVRTMIEKGTNAPIHDIDNPVDEHFFALEPKDGHDREGRILCVGWVNERKNTLGSVKAFASAIQKGAKGTLVIAGHASDENYRALIDTEIERSGITDCVEFLGHINREQLTAELSRATVLLLPSLQENAPMAISEAMASSVAVVASDRCGMPFMITEGESGFLIDPLDSEQIAERLVKLLDDAALCSGFGRKGREIAFERFHPKVVAAKTKAVYDSLCAK